MAKTSKHTVRKSPSPDLQNQTDLCRKWTVAIFFLGCLLYANTLGHDYTQDDAIVIYDNMYTTQGVKGIPGLLTRDTFFGFFKVEGKSRLVQGGRYRPLTPVMFALEWQLAGRSPWLGHFVNMILYGITGVVVFMLLHWMGRFSHLAKQALPFAIAGTVLYVVHPLHTEAVANIKGRDEMMSFLLSILALWILLKNQPVVRPRARILSAACLFLALLSKENAITFLLIIPMALVFFAKHTWIQAFKQTLPFLGATILFLVIRGQVIGWSFGDAPRELLNNPFLKIVNNQYVDFSMGEKLATIFFTLGKYVELLFIPHPLTHDYYPRHIDIMQFSDWKVMVSVLCYIALIVAGLVGFRHGKVWAFGILFFLITLSIVSNMVFPIGTNMSERFMYMPSLGWSIALAALFVRILTFRKNLAWILLGIVSLGFAVLTMMRNPVWKSNYTLFTSDIHTSQRSAKLLAATGGELVTQFGTKPQSPERDEKLTEAIGYLDRAQEIHPNYKLSYLLEGNAQYYLKHWDASIAAYQRVLTLSPDDTDARKNLGIAYRDAGRFFGEQQKDINKALRYLSEAIKILPDDYETVHALGVAYGIGGNAAEAVSYFKKGVEIQPNNATAHFNLGLAYQRIGDQVNAQIHQERAIALDPQILERRKQ